MDEQLRTIFSNNLKRLLARPGKTQSDMCKYMKISSATASDWCNSKKMPRADKLQSLCSWLDCELSDLISEEPAASPDPVDVQKTQLLKYYELLNEEGRNRLIEQAQFFASQDKYKETKIDESAG